MRLDNIGVASLHEPLKELAAKAKEKDGKVGAPVQGRNVCLKSGGCRLFLAQLGLIESAPVPHFLHVGWDVMVRALGENCSSARKHTYPSILSTHGRRQNFSREVIFFSSGRGTTKNYLGRGTIFEIQGMGREVAKRKIFFHNYH